MGLQFRILGPLEVLDEHGPLAAGAGKPRAVLAVLLLHANQPVSAERLAIALWGAEAPAGAVKTVHVYVSRLRKALGDPALIETTPAGYRLRVRPGQFDLARFQRGAEAGRRALATGQPERAVALLGEALELWRGRALADLEFEPFAAGEIARLEEQRLGAIETRVDADLATGANAALVSELRQLVAEYPERERLAGQLMLALYRSGRQTEALEVFRHTRRVLVNEAGVEPGSGLKQLHRAILNQDATLDAVPAPRRRGGALPTPPNRTIGRAHEIRAIADRLRAGQTRLLTLTGPGGVGKTRLALAAARVVEADFADGAYFVSLAAVRRSDDVAAAIASSLAVVAVGDESAEETVTRFLAARHLLLVLDNCEHVTAAAPLIGRILAAAGVTGLATSREPLAIAAEHVHLVPPLGAPRPQAPVNIGALAAVDAVALFCERARAHAADFELNEGNADAVVAICRRLDGLPLAIELAAARCALLSPGEIAVRLQGALGVLGTGPRDAPARQRTLGATLDWSHGLLDTADQTCFARFAVFAGSASVHAAETVTGAGLDTFDRLVAKNLLLRHCNNDGATRLGMLQTVRAYAGERFAAMPDREALRARHFGYYLWLARRHGRPQALDGPEHRKHLARLDDASDNLREALHWAAERDACESVLELSASLVDFWMRRDRYAEAVHWILPALQRPGSDPALRARALCKACWPLWTLGRKDTLLGLLAEAEATVATLTDPTIRAEVLYQCGALRSLSGRPDIGARTATEALEDARRCGDDWTMGLAAWARALASGRGAGDASDLRERVREAAALLERAGNAFHLAHLFANAGSCSLRRGWDGEAAVYLRRAVGLARELDLPFLWMMLREKVGLSALFAGDSQAAHEAFCEELALSRDLVVLRVAAQALVGLAAVAVVDDQPERAARLVGAALTAGRGLTETDDAMRVRLHTEFLAPARKRFGADPWDAAVAIGASMNLEDAIAYAGQTSRAHARRGALASPVSAGGDR